MYVYYVRRTFMKREHLIKTITRAAKAQGTTFKLIRQGKHEVWHFGTKPVIIPRHKEIGEQLARKIIKQATEEA